MNKLFCLVVCMSVSILSIHAQGKKNSSKTTPYLQLEIREFLVNDNALPLYMRQIYYKDAARLALRLLALEQKNNQQTVLIPEELQQYIYTDLTAIRLSGQPEADSVSRLFYVRTYPDLYTDSLVIMIKPNEVWAQPLQQGFDTTQNESFNQLLRRFNLSCQYKKLDNTNDLIIVKSPAPINIAALRHQLTALALYCPPQANPYRDGSDITVLFNPKTMAHEYTYYLRWDGCATNCNKEHFWRFSVSFGGELVFLKSGGDAIPADFMPSKMALDYPDVLNSN